MHGKSKVLIEFTVSFKCHPIFVKKRGELFNQIDGAMLSTGAADGHRHIASMVLIQGWKPIG